MQKLIALVVMASFATGCTLVGAGIGGAHPKPVPADSNEPAGDHMLEGALVGLLLDVAMIVLVRNTLHSWDCFSLNGEKKPSGC